MSTVTGGVLSHIADIEKTDISGATSPLQIKANEVRSSRINWQSYVQGQMISVEDYTVINNLDLGPKSSEARVTYFKQNPQICVAVLFRLLRKIAKEQTLQYILTLIDDILQDDHSLVDVMKREAAVQVEQAAWTPFFHMFTREDGFIVNQSSRIVAKLACWSIERMEPRALDYYIHFLKEHLRKQGYEFLITITRCLQMMLRVDEYRHAFVAADGISCLVQVLSAPGLGFQLHYQLVFCLWSLTFNTDIAEQMTRYNVVPVLADILNASVKEKVTRIIMATFRNFLEKPREKEICQAFALAMVQCKVPKTLSLLIESKRASGDPELKEDLEFVHEFLLRSVSDFSSFDEYREEVRSGRLEWSPVHREDRFWRENCDRLNEQNYELLKMLIHLLETSREPLILCVAAHDIGEYVRYYSRGKRVIEQLGGKAIVMGLLAHDDPNVRYQALLAVHKLMVQNCPVELFLELRRRREALIRHQEMEGIRRIPPPAMRLLIPAAYHPFFELLAAPHDLEEYLGKKLEKVSINAPGDMGLTTAALVR